MATPKRNAPASKPVKFLPGIRYDGPPELAEAWNEFTRDYANTCHERQDNGQFLRIPVSGPLAEHIAAANQINTLLFRDKLASFEPGKRDALKFLSSNYDREPFEDVCLAISQLAAKDCSLHDHLLLYNFIVKNFADRWAARVAAKREQMNRETGLNFCSLGQLTQADRQTLEAARRNFIAEDMTNVLYNGLRLMHAGLITRWAQRSHLLHPNDPELVDEAVDKIYHRVLFGYDASRSRNFSNFLYVALRGKGKEQKGVEEEISRRQNVKHAFFTNSVSPYSEPIFGEGGFTPEDTYNPQHENEVREQMCVTLGALEQLPPRQRQVIYMRYLDMNPLNSKQVAEALGISRSVSCTDEKKAIKHLQQILCADEEAAHGGRE